MAVWHVRNINDNSINDIVHFQGFALYFTEL